MADRRLLALSFVAALAGSIAQAAAPTSTSSALLFLDRLTFGPTSADVERYRQLGPARWLDEQLRPPRGADVLPAPAQAQIDALPLSRTNVATLLADTASRQKALAAITDPDLKAAAGKAHQQAMTDVARQAATREILRALYSPAQLRERLAWFWLNHFNVSRNKADLRVAVGDYAETAIRPHVLGRFRDLLGATLRHPAMLRYLDNAQNVAGRINENYAREIMELHTMGVGSGYTQHDVEELARILTGVGLDRTGDSPKMAPQLEPQLVRDGAFIFNPARHDYGDKVFLGHAIAGRGFAEVEEALDILARQPATAHHIARRLATYFVADDPPPALVEGMAQSFLRTDGDLTAVIRAMVDAPEFTAARPGKFKDPVRYIFSAVRLAYEGKVIANTAPIQGWLDRAGEGLFNHETPDGYPLAASSWNGPGQLALRFDIAKQIGSGPAGLFKPEGGGAVEQPAFPQLQNALYFDGLRQTLAPATAAALDAATSLPEWNTLFLASPEFMR